MNSEYEISLLLKDLKTLQKAVEEMKTTPLGSTFEYKSIIPLTQLYEKYLDRAKLIYDQNRIFTELIKLPEKTNLQHLQRLKLNVDKLVDFIEHDKFFKQYKLLVKKYKLLKEENKKLKNDIESYNKIK